MDTTKIDAQCCRSVNENQETRHDCPLLKHKGDGAAIYSYSYYLAGCSISHIYMSVPQYLSHNILLPVCQLHLESALQPVLGPTVALPLAYLWPTVGLLRLCLCTNKGQCDHSLK